MIEEMWAKYAEVLPGGVQGGEAVVEIMRAIWFHAAAAVLQEQHALLLHDAPKSPPEDPDETDAWLGRFSSQFVRVHSAWQAEVHAAFAIMRIQGAETVVPEPETEPLAFDVLVDLDRHLKRVPQLNRDAELAAFAKLHFVVGYATVLKRLRDYLKNAEPSIQTVRETVDGNILRCVQVAAQFEEQRRGRARPAVWFHRFWKS
jgi:hypothetical protein